MTDRLIELHKRALPDSRTRELRGSIRTPFGEAQPVYCANCAKFKGYVFVATEFMFYLCDDCDVHGTGVDLPVVPADEIGQIG